jgi:hypothetical protein
VSAPSQKDGGIPCALAAKGVSFLEAPFASVAQRLTLAKLVALES